MHYCDRLQQNVVLLTGATGMVGSQLMAKLLASGVSVAVLARDTVRRNASVAKRTTVSAHDRIEALLTRFESGWEQRLSRPLVIRGDLNSESLGLEPKILDWIANNVTRVIHSAASLSFRPASESSGGEPYRTNVGGTTNLIKVCRNAGIDNFHYVSTAYICGLRSGRVYEAEQACDQQFSNDYEHSKCQAEQLVRSESAWPSATIYRPSIVIDSSGLSPVTEDRTVYGAYSLFETLASKFGLPQPGEWFRNLGFTGHERKNLVQAEWVAETICRIFLSEKLHGKTYHLTDNNGTTISELEKAFYEVASQVIQSENTKADRRPASVAIGHKRSRPEVLDAIAAPFVETFRPYFRDDPSFDRQNVELATESIGLVQHPTISATTIAAMIRHRRESEQASGQVAKARDDAAFTTGTIPSQNAGQQAVPCDHDDDDPVVIVGRAVRLPGGVDDVQQFEQLLFNGQSALAPVPESRFDRELYFDNRRGQVGKSYTQFGGCVSPEPLDHAIESEIASLGQFDLTHRQFAQVAVTAWTDSGLAVDTRKHATLPPVVGSLSGTLAALTKVGRWQWQRSPTRHWTLSKKLTLSLSYPFQRVKVYVNVSLIACATDARFAQMIRFTLMPTPPRR